MSGERGRALVVRRPGEMVLEERDFPPPRPDGVLIRPDTVGLCGTDLDIVAGRVDPAYTRYPLVLGHEWSGTVAGPLAVEAAAALGGVLAAGTRVVGEGIVPCGHCPRCRAGQTNLCLTYDELGFTRDGAAASFLAVAAALVHPLAPVVSAEDGALVEPASVVYRALSGIMTPGWRALVVGDGTVALLAVRLLGLWFPAETVMLGRREGQAGLAATAGAARFETDPRAAGGGYDLVVEAAGTTDAVLTALGAARRGGTGCAPRLDGRTQAWPAPRPWTPSRPRHRNRDRACPAPAPSPAWAGVSASCGVTARDDRRAGTAVGGRPRWPAAPQPAAGKAARRGAPVTGAGPAGRPGCPRLPGHRRRPVTQADGVPARLLRGPRDRLRAVLDGRRDQELPDAAG